MAELTPMMQQYMKTKEEYKDCILFYRLGDFYEMFFDDAKIASKELELTLTGKNCGLEERAPMCGIPYHAVEGYLSRLVSKGYKVAICEQMEDPALAKGLVRREVVRIVTPGTNICEQSLDESRNNYIMSIVYVSDRFGISFADVTTGDYFVTEVDSARKLMDEMYKFSPREVVCNEALMMSGIDFQDMKDRLGFTMYSLENWYFDDDLCRQGLLDHFHVKSLEGLGVSDFGCGIIAAGALLRYLTETQKTSLEHLSKLIPYVSGNYMVIDSSSRRNLELTQTLRGDDGPTLFSLLDQCKTSMGSRLLRQWIHNPLRDTQAVGARHQAVESFLIAEHLRQSVRDKLKTVPDFERLATRIAMRTIRPKELAALRDSLPHLADIARELITADDPLIEHGQEGL